MNEERLFELIEQVYAAAGTSEGWLAFLDNVRATFHGSTANLIRHDLHDRRGNMLVTSGADPGGTALYQQHWGAVDPWAYSPRQARLRNQAVTLGEELVAHRELQRTAFYSDFARHYDLIRLIGGVVSADPHTSSVLSISRSEAQQPFDREDAAFLEALLPHIRQALRLHERVVTAETTSSNVAQVVNRSSVATLLVTARAEVTFVNEPAMRLLATRDGLVVHRGELHAMDPADTSRLRQLIADAARVASRAGSGGVSAVRRRSTHRPLAVLVSPVPGSHLWPVPHATAAAIFVTDPDARAEIDQSALRALFGLTPAESRLTVLLAHGTSLTEAAALLGLRLATVRSRLKAIFVKTGTNRQADLVRLVLMS
jgi:DNA-binding CsgD family transcriptional regulator